MRSRNAAHALVVMLMMDMAFAQSYPSKPVRFVVPTSAGGGADVVARALGQKLAATLGQPMVYDNRAGAGGIIGTEIAAKSPADGYTLLIVTSAHTINPSLYAKLPYDTKQDFAPVGLVASLAYLLTVHPSLPVRSVGELIALAHAKPHQMNFGSAGTGSSNHLVMESFKLTAGIDVAHVPYKGGSPAATALISGEVQLSFASPTNSLPFIKAGRLRGIAVTSSARLPIAPDLPTIAEAGFLGYQDIGWYGILAPAGVPREIVSKINQALTKAQQHPDVREFYARQGIDQATTTSVEDFAEVIRNEIAKWSKVVAAAGIRASQY